MKHYNPQLILELEVYIPIDNIDLEVKNLEPKAHLVGGQSHAPKPILNYHWYLPNSYFPNVTSVFLPAHYLIQF